MDQFTEGKSDLDFLISVSWHFLCNQYDTLRLTIRRLSISHKLIFSMFFNILIDNHRRVSSSSRYERRHRFALRTDGGTELVPSGHICQPASCRLCRMRGRMAASQCRVSEDFENASLPLACRRFGREARHPLYALYGKMPAFRLRRCLLQGRHGRIDSLLASRIQPSRFERQSHYRV